MYSSFLCHITFSRYFFVLILQMFIHSFFYFFFFTIFRWLKRDLLWPECCCCVPLRQTRQNVEIYNLASPINNHTTPFRRWPCAWWPRAGHKGTHDTSIHAYYAPPPPIFINVLLVWNISPAFSVFDTLAFLLSLCFVFWHLFIFDDFEVSYSLQFFF